MDKIFLSVLLLSLLFSCSQSINKGEDGSGEALKMRQQLMNLSGSGIFFGHQDDLAYGIGWNGIPGESDVKRVTGSYPAIFGWELGNIGEVRNLDGVPFDSIKTYIKRAYRLGGINTISWHARNPATNFDAWNLSQVNVSSLLPGGEHHSQFISRLNLIAGFLADLKTDNGELIPLIFRPWHEMYGNWFWWGISTCTDEEYKQLYQFTCNYLRKNKGLKNLLFAFSPDRNFNSEEEYLRRYPGDDYVDILGLDDYADFRDNRLDMIVVRLGIVSDLAREKDKIAAFTETGSDRLTIPNWYSANLLQVLNASEKTRCISYVMVWRNRDINHFYVPWNGSGKEDDFRNFVNDKLIFLLDDLKKQQ